MISRPSRTLSESRDPSKLWLDKNEVHDNKIHKFVIEHIATCPQRTFSSYPDLSETYRLLSRRLNLPIDHLYIGNGSDAIIKAVFENFVKEKGSIFLRSPTFAMYEVYSNFFHASKVDFLYKFDPDAFCFNWNYESFELSIPKVMPSVIFLANPDSPTGSYFSEKYLFHLIELASKAGSIVCIDAVYDDFTPNPLNFSKILEHFNNVIIIYSASKSWGLAGVRLGFALGSSDLIKKLHRSRPMYEIGSLQAYIFNKVLKEPKLVASVIKKVLNNKRKVEQAIKSSSIEMVETVGNFIIFEDNLEICEALKHTCVIRRGWSAGPMKNLARISISSEMNCDLVTKIFK